MTRNPVARWMRGLSAPVRTYFNGHFEAVKDEVRAHDRSEAVASELGEIVERIGRLEQRAAADSARLDDRLERLEEMVAELRATNDQLLAVVAALTPQMDDVT